MGTEIPEREILINIAKIQQNIEPSEDKKDELMVAMLAVLEGKRSASLQN
jgi:hypothetical protein